MAILSNKYKMYYKMGKMLNILPTIKFKLLQLFTQKLYLHLRMQSLVITDQPLQLVKQTHILLI